MIEDTPGGPAEDQDQMEDKSAFRDDPRGAQEVSEQQPETQQSEGDGEGRRERTGDQGAGGETGRDDPDQATGNPPNAG